MEFAGDAIGQQLAVDIMQRAVVRKRYAGAGHDGALESVAMQVDDAGQHQQVAGVQPGRAWLDRGGAIAAAAVAKNQLAGPQRTEARRVGKECVRPCKSRWSTEP